jgi:hypothetical protein
MIYAALPERVYAQTRTTATVTATVIPSISLELLKSNALITKEELSPQTFEGPETFSLSWIRKK